MDTRTSIRKADELIQIKVAEAIEAEREKHMRTEQELIRTKNQLRVLKLAIFELQYLQKLLFIKGFCAGSSSSA